MSSKPARFIEPFAGGAIVGLNVAFRRLADHVTLVELDPGVAAVWQTIIYGEAQRLAERIRRFDLTAESVEAELRGPPRDAEDRAFQTLLRNRINRDGILAPGAGRLRYGENGKGIASRWYPETLKKRILEINVMRSRVTFLQDDGLVVLKRNANCANAAFFMDPPYTVGGKQAGKRLYNYHQLDHEELFRIAGMLSGSFLMTYSNDEKVRELARRHEFETCEITVRNSQKREATELLIARDLSWIQSWRD